MIVRTPYIYVQAIRRMYRDAGRPTFAKPGGYGITLNFPGGVGATNDTVVGSLVTDSDSDFVWLSTYFYNQNAAWNPEVAANGIESDSVGNIKLTLGDTGQQLTTPAFLPLMFVDGSMVAFSQTALLPGGSEILEADFAGVRGNVGIWRSFWPEPIIIKATGTVHAEIQSQGFVSEPGNIVYLSGVRLFEKGA